MTGHVALIRLSWPNKALSKNASSPWGRKNQRARSAATANQRMEAWTLARQQGAHRLNTTTPRLVFSFHPPDNRTRDLQNLLGMLAGAIDGIADAMGCDDSGFRCVWPETWGDPVKGGCVLIELTE